MPIPPIVGQGIMPVAGPVADELAAITRRAFIPMLIVQIYQSTPLLQALIDNAQFATGGFDPITLPVQGQPLTTMSWSGYGGTFNQPATQTGLTIAQGTLKLAVVPIQFLGMEGTLQLNHAVIPLLEARLNDATTVMKQGFANALYNNTALTNPLAMTGLPDAIDDGTNADVYLGISRAANPYWRATLVNIGGVNPTRLIVSQYINSIVKKCGEAPSAGYTGFGTWTQLAADFLPLERYNHSTGSPGYDMMPSGFRALEVSGVPIYPDPFAPEGIIRFANHGYLNLYIHEAASFEFSGFHSVIPLNQIGYVGVLATVLELINGKPVSSLAMTNCGYLPI